ncbi:MAG: elongation factor G [Nitrospirota bacterium]|nr:elongation factor G [Nitrospirota bacterium]
MAHNHSSSFDATLLQAEDPRKIRNVVLLGHSQSGKTLLAEALLSLSGRISPLGIVDQNTRRDRVMDTDDDEKSRGISYMTAAAATSWTSANGDTAKINLFDTPGIGELFPESLSALSVCDGAILCVSGQDGIQTLTRKAFREAKNRNLGILIAVTKLDKEHADYFELCKKLNETLGRGVVPTNIPIGSGPDYQGVINLIDMKAHYYEDNGSGKERVEEIPAKYLEVAKEHRIRIEELAAEMNDTLLDHYLSTGDLTEEEFISGVHDGVREGRIVPIMSTSAARSIGLRQVLNRVVEFIPHPDEHPASAHRDSGDYFSLVPTPGGPPCAFVFKTSVDPFAGRISYLKAVSGRITADMELTNHSGGTERLGRLFTPLGSKLEELPHACAGDIFCAVKLKNTKTGDTLHGKEVAYFIDPVAYPEPVLSIAIEPKSRGDEDKLSNGIQKLCEEDPRLKADRDADSNELLLNGYGQLHLEMALTRLKARFGVDAATHPPSIPYRETIKGTSETHARHKKQSGGHGQFADIHVRLEPMPRGGGFEFADDIFGGAVPRNFIPAVEKGLIEAKTKGVLAGYPAVDFKATLFDGSYHTVDSSEMAFKIAAHTAFKEGFAKARPTLLEPYMAMEITVPENCMGDVMGDLNQRRGRVRGINTDGGESIIEAEAPLAELLTYANSLKSITGDRGTFTMHFLDYEEVPPHLQNKIVDERTAVATGRR